VGGVGGVGVAMVVALSPYVEIAELLAMVDEVRRLV
jgi:hypothetical protein